ncbi:MAG: family 65 glycosyl hydrolase [Oscillospiraceae bacterium]|nr:family 65 glycosyl hydrolase [Oscillospiraceae bacterium]
MPKYADKYFKLDDWKIIAEDFDAGRNRVAESVFSLSNEFMGARGFFEEGISSGDSLTGCYFNGIYEIDEKMPRSYKGIVTKTHYMVPACNWLYTKIEAGGEKLDIAKSEIADLVRVLDMKEGVYARSFFWKTAKGGLKLKFTRFIDMTRPHGAYLEVEIQSIDFIGEIKFETGVDFDTKHETYNKKVFREAANESVDSEPGMFIIGETLESKHKVLSGFEVGVNIAEDKNYERIRIQREKYIGMDFKFNLDSGEKIAFYKTVCNLPESDPSVNIRDLLDKGRGLLDIQVTEGYHTAYSRQVKAWGEFWDNFDIVIEGDPENQQGIRFCLFQLNQTYRGGSPSHNIGAKGLTGEAYNGHAFWDTETYCLPFYLFNNPAAAKSLLEYRYFTLPQALERAKMLDMDGACYPIATLNGEEACALWQHSNLQFQPTTAVAFGIWHYVKLTDDRDFLYTKGVEMLVYISRFLKSRGGYGGVTGKFGYFGVMGPDEFHMMADNDCYTNYISKKSLEYTVEVLEEMKESAKDKFIAVKAKLNIADEEIKEYEKLAKDMYIPYDEETQIFEQHDGFFNLPHTDIKSIPAEQFPLYSHWSYDRIYRTDMIKQPAVLMLMFLYNSDFTYNQKLKNYEYYEPRTIHESSLSPSLHSVLAAELGKSDEAYAFFSNATRMDLDNYNRNTNEGLHTTSIAAAWINVLYGFGGMRSDGEIISFAPSIPKDWKSYSFKVLVRGVLVKVEVNHDRVKFTPSGDIVLKIYGEEKKIGGEGYEKIL